MRCSSCERALPAYVDGSLSARKRAAVAKHVRECAACAALYHELRSVDALLESGTTGELPSSFTRDLMGRVKDLPPPRRGRPFLQLGAAYLALAWLAGAVAIWLLHLAGPFSGGAFAPLVEGFDAGVTGARSLWPIAPIAFAAGATILAVDALLLAGILLYYRNVRPHVAATLAIAERR